MMKIVASFVIVMFFSINGYSKSQDSIGNKMVNGNRYVMHKITKGEGVYSISKKYGVPSNAIFEANPGSEKGIKIDQVLLIPRGKGMAVNTQVAPKTNTVNEVAKTHKVVKGNTLSSIAKQYNLTLQEIKQINNLTSDNIQLGQQLKVSKSNVVTPEVVADKANPDGKEKPKAVVPEDNEVEVAIVPKAEVEQTLNSEAIQNKYTTTDGDEVTENGKALISSEGELYQERSFILHPSAKVGTIVMITNPSNNNAVFARVIGNCAPIDGAVLKMSKTVAMKLGVSNDLNVKVSYAK
jgi:LysM repeat protein